MNPYQILKDVLFYSLIILCIIILYRLLINRLSRGRHIGANFCVLYSLDVNPSSGIIPFYFTTEMAKKVEFTIESDDKILIEIANREFEVGGHILRFDSTKLPNGLYFYCLKTNGQETKKKFRIAN